MSSILELAERCEKATGPDRELDCLIFEAQHLLLMPNHRGMIDGEPTGEYYSPDGNQLPERAPRYTASIDASLTLVPQGFASAVGTMAFEGSASKPWGCYWEPNGKPHTFEAATPALALCAAALRALAALPRKEG